jgi:hypothetical protein
MARILSDVAKRTHNQLIDFAGVRCFDERQRMNRQQTTSVDNLKLTPQQQLYFQHGRLLGPDRYSVVFRVGLGVTGCVAEGQHCDAENCKRLKFLTNNFTLPALTIAQIYKQRWLSPLSLIWAQGR